MNQGVAFGLTLVAAMAASEGAGAQKWDLRRCREAVPAPAFKPENRLSGAQLREMLSGKTVVTVRRSPLVSDPGFVRLSAEYRVDGSLRLVYESGPTAGGPWKLAPSRPTRAGALERGNATIGTWHMKGNAVCTDSLNTPPACFEVFRSGAELYQHQVEGATSCQSRFQIQ